MEGVYILGKAGHPLYVGTSKYMQCRFSAHKVKGYDSRWFQLIGAPERFALERDLIRVLRPPLNIQMTGAAMRVYPVRLKTSHLKKLEIMALRQRLGPQHLIREAIRLYLKGRVV
jgi:hypothetical protein